MKRIILAGMLISTASLFASEINVGIRYQNINTGNIDRVKALKAIDLESGKTVVSDLGIEKTIVVSQMANLFSETLKASSSICKNTYTPRRCLPIVRPTRPRTGTSATSVMPERCIPVVDEDLEARNKKCSLAAAKIAKKLTIDLNRLNTQVLALNSADESVMDFLTLGHKLSKNIKEKKFQSVHEGRVATTVSRGRMQRTSPATTSMQQGSLNVTAGGAQSVEFFIKNVKDGYVPHTSSFTTEGFISHFDLPLANSSECKSLLCIDPAYKLDLKAKKLFIQLGMGTNITAESFKRRKLNLSVVLDISGSMSATDGTEIARIDWAKKALLKTVSKMNKDDMLSIVLFNSESKTLLAPTAVSDIASLKKLISTIEAGGSTNLETGLRDGFNLVSEGFKKSYENRVILISDAGANTGRTSEADLLKLVSDFAGEDIGLTAIGLGLNFKQELIHGITMSKGSNYVFVNSGKGLKNYFSQFDFLVSPIAYNLKAELSIEGLDAELVKAYGVPMKKDSEVQDILDIRTLFLASAGSGGAILLEYDLK